MEKIAIKNKFRVVTLNGEKVRLNSTIDVNGNYRYIEGFETIEEAQGALVLFARSSGGKETDFKIETYAEQYRLTVPVVEDKEINAELERRKIFSGKALQYNTYIQKRDENKYKSGKFYTREIWLAQSAEHNKGISLISRLGDKKKHTGEDHYTFHRIKDSGSVNFAEDSLLISLKRKHFANRKELKDYLKPLGFSNRRIERLFHLLTM